MRPLVMGIVNVTPDSFSDGGRHDRPAEAVEHARRLIAEGADIIDVGGESSRPGAAPVDAETELSRVLPVITALAGEIRISVDTAKAEVAREAIAAGATLINDITSSTELAAVAAGAGVGWMAMHMKGEPRTMQQAPVYGDVVTEVLQHLVGRAESARELGVAEIWIDPGIGFGKTAEHNWQVLRSLERYVATGWPVAVGTSRKAFLGSVSALADGADQPTPTDDRLEASLATTLHAACTGVGLVRVHDVAATVAALDAAGLRRADAEDDAERPVGAHTISDTTTQKEKTTWR